MKLGMAVNEDMSVNKVIKKKLILAKEPDDLIIIRQLRGNSNILDLDLADEEINPSQMALQDENTFKNEYTYKLAKLIQLSGYSDPIYAEAFVDIHKYDILFEILFINQTSKRIQNVRVEFST